MGLRILHIAPFNFSGVPIELVKAERKLGHYSRLITLGKDTRNYEEDICLNLPWLDNPILRKIKEIVQPKERREERNIIKIPKELPPKWKPGNVEIFLFNLRDLLWKKKVNKVIKKSDFWGFDIYQLDGGIEFSRNGKFMKKAKALGKKIVCCYLGIDMRITGVIPEIDKLSDLNVTFEFDHLKLYPGIHFLLYPFDASEFRQREKENEILRICHAPTVRKTKGTDKIIKCIKGLEKLYPCELVLIEGVTHEEAVKIKYTCDILVDQLGELGYGINSLESLAMGIPTCVELTPELENEIGEHPFIKVNEENLGEKLIQLINNKELRQEKAKKGREWVVKHHNPIKIVKEIHNLLGI
ncbi:MAG: glycosyltransferase [bacterium]|nr:glycosyltransferase [bacterium]